VEQYIKSCVVFHIIPDFVIHCSAIFMVQKELLGEVVDVVCASNDYSMSKEITASGMVDLWRLVRKRVQEVVGLWVPSREEAA
jgi:hypothetical protein